MSKKFKVDPKWEFTCNVCGKKGYNKYWMELHIARNHDIKDDRKAVNQQIIPKRNW